MVGGAVGVAGVGAGVISSTSSLANTTWAV